MALPDPVTRKEMYLNKAATGSGSVPPEPVTREEMYLAEIANGGGGSGGGSQEPLVLTAVPYSEQNPFLGVAVGATRNEIVAAWNAGRLIRLKLGATELAFSLADHLTASNATLIAYFMYKVGDNQFFCKGSLDLKASALTYNVTVFSGLTPVTN